MSSVKSKRPVVDYSGCVGCGECVTFCPFSCLELSLTGMDRYNTRYPALTGKGNEDCTSCGICAAKCPIGVITMENPRN